jgi:hypothetical protein
VVDTLWVVDVDAEALGSEQLDGEHFRARDSLFDSARQLLLELPLLGVYAFHLTSHVYCAPVPD